MEGVPSAPTRRETHRGEFSSSWPEPMGLGSTMPFASCFPPGGEDPFLKLAASDAIERGGGTVTGLRRVEGAHGPAPRRSARPAPWWPDESPEVDCHPSAPDPAGGCAQSHFVNPLGLPRATSPRAVPDDRGCAGSWAWALVSRASSANVKGPAGSLSRSTPTAPEQGPGPSAGARTRATVTVLCRRLEDQPSSSRSSATRKTGFKSACAGACRARQVRMARSCTISKAVL